MKRFGNFVVKARYIILILSILLLIPAAIGYFNTRVNYDLLYYLPDGIDTMEGQQILMDDFGSGAFGILLVENMDDYHVAELKDKIEGVDHVKNVLWYNSFADLSIPKSMLPQKIYDTFNAENSTIMMVIFDDTSSGDGTMKAIEKIRTVTDHQCKVSGISAIVTDTKALSEQETPIYVGIAVLISIVILALLMDSWAIPIFFLLSIGMAIIYNLGSNFVVGEISYVTKALAAVLQLAVTMDYSIFLWHSYEENLKKNHGKREEAMADAISSTISSVVGSSVTTVAGFIALCFMSFTLGMDLGVVMAKGVILGVISCVTILPSMILVFHKLLEKTAHRQLLPEFRRIPNFITKHYLLFFIIFLVLLVPAIFGNTHTKVYFDLSRSLPESLDCIQARETISDKYHLSSANIVLLDADTPKKTVKQMMEEMKQVDGVETVLGLESVLDNSIPDSFIPKELTSNFRTDDYEMFVFMSSYTNGTEEANKQCNTVEKIIKKYDKTGMLVGEAACTRDLIEITDKDF